MATFPAGQAFLGRDACRSALPRASGRRDDPAHLFRRVLQDLPSDAVNTDAVPARLNVAGASVDPDVDRSDVALGHYLEPFQGLVRDCHLSALGAKELEDAVW